MLSLLNFKENIAEPVLKRGEQYHASGAISGIEQVAPGKWEAEISGTEMYRVSISLNTNREVSSHACNCRYEGPICKHVKENRFDFGRWKLILKK